MEAFCKLPDVPHSNIRSSSITHFCAAVPLKTSFRMKTARDLCIWTATSNLKKILRICEVKKMNAESYLRVLKIHSIFTKLILQ